MSNAEKPTYAEKHMDKFAELFERFSKLSQFEALEDNDVVSLFIAWTDAYQSSKVASKKKAEEKPTARQISTLKSLMKKGFVEEEDIEQISKTRASYLIGQGFAKQSEAAEEAAEEVESPF
jgi:hypothetical protein